MKATINENGVLKVSAETNLEAFALKMWCEKQSDKKASSEIDLDIEIKLKY